MASGRGLGTLTLDLVAKVGGFTSGLDKAGRELDKKTRAMQKRAYEFGQAIGTALKVGAGLAVAALGIYIKNTIEAEKVQAQLTARIKDTAGVAGRSIQQLNAQAEKLQNLTVFDDESIGRAQAALMVFTRVRDLNFDRTIEAATDLATVTGKDLTVAAQTLGKALNDPIRGVALLRRNGVSLTEAQEDLIKSLVKVGDVAGAGTIMLDAIAGKMGTAAEAARNTLGGALESLKNAFDNLLEGDSGDAGINGTTEAINDLTSTLSSAQTKAAIDDIASMVVGLVADFARGVSGLAAFISQVRTLQSVGSGGSMVGLSDADLKAAMAGKQNQIQALKTTGRKSFGPGTSTLDDLLATRKQLVAEYTRRIKADTSLQMPGMVTMDPMTIFMPGKDKEGASKASAAARKAQAAAEREAAAAAKRHAEALQELWDELEKTEKASQEFTLQLEDLIAAQGGPLAEAQLSYNRELKDLQKLAEEGEVSTTDLAKAEELLGIAYAKTTAEIRERLNTGGQQLKQMQQELDLLNMQTNAERVRAQFLIDHPTATGDQADAAVRLDQQIEETRQAISAMDDFRSSFEDFVVAAANGKASFKDFADMVIQQIIRMGAAKIAAGLFGESGTTGGGLFGSLLAGIFGGGSAGSFSGGGMGIGGGVSSGFAMGTDYAPGGPAWVGERGPEIVNLPRGASVTPNHKLGRGMKPNVNLNIYGSTSRETTQYAANLLARELMKAGRGS